MFMQKSDFYEKARKILNKGHVCDHCLGRQFAQLLSGFDNSERGRSIRNFFAMLIETGEEPEVNVSNFSSYKFRFASLEKKEKECIVCENLFENMDFFVKKAIKKTEKLDFKEDSDFDVGVFVNGNTYDAVLDKHVTTIKITFEKGYHFDLSHFGYNELDAHATGLFFEPYLKINGRNEEIHMGDLRVVFVPEDWEWPSPDGTPIWERYPYDFKTGNGVYHDDRADEPIFVGKWYMV